MNILFFFTTDKCGLVEISNSKVESDPQNFVKSGSYNRSNGNWREVTLVDEKPEYVDVTAEVSRTIEGTCQPKCCVTFEGDQKGQTHSRWFFYKKDGTRRLSKDLECIHVEFKVCFGELCFGKLPNNKSLSAFVPTSIAYMVDVRHLDGLVLSKYELGAKRKTFRYVYRM